jgi:hypothetical protein
MEFIHKKKAEKARSKQLQDQVRHSSFASRHESFSCVTQKYAFRQKLLYWKRIFPYPKPWFFQYTVLLKFGGLFSNYRLRRFLRHFIIWPLSRVGSIYRINNPNFLLKVHKYQPSGLTFHFFLSLLVEGSSVADPGCLTRILILTHPGSKNINENQGWKKNCCRTFLEP